MKVKKTIEACYTLKLNEEEAELLLQALVQTNAVAISEAYGCDPVDIKQACNTMYDDLAAFVDGYG